MPTLIKICFSWTKGPSNHSLEKEQIWKKSLLIEDLQGDNTAWLKYFENTRWITL